MNMFDRKFEYFSKLVLKEQSVITNSPRYLFRQERDWTCSVACLRSILSGIEKNIKSEEEYISMFKFDVGPHYSCDIKNKGILSEVKALYGCDFDDITFDELLVYLKKGYYIMVETMINYAHWLVLLGYFPLQDNDAEHAEVLLYDPYYDKVRLISADEFMSMWIDGDYEHTRVKKDFIAIKKPQV